MPIIQISMVPSYLRETYNELKINLEKQVLNQEIEGIKSGEIMIDIHELPTDATPNGFVYIQIWMYNERKRTPPVIMKLQDIICQVASSHFVKYYREFLMLEVLPINMLNPIQCSVFVK